MDLFVYDGTRYLILFGEEKYYFIYNRIRYFMGVKRVIIYVISYNYAKIKSSSKWFFTSRKIIDFSCYHAVTAA